MPAELVPGAIRVQAVFQGMSGLPEDRYVNVFHFASTGDGGPINDQMTDAIAAVREFYVAPVPPTAETIQERMPSEIINESLSELRAYNLALPDPRIPTIEPFGPLLTMQGGIAMPEEVALCLSYFSLVNQPSSRGRIYLGPLRTATLRIGTTNARPTDDFVTTILASARRLMLRPGPIWSVLCHPTGIGPVLKTITEGWVDNSFDTIRKRGVASTGRVGFTVGFPV